MVSGIDKQRDEESRTGRDLGWLSPRLGGIPLDAGLAFHDLGNNKVGQFDLDRLLKLLAAMRTDSVPTTEGEKT